MLWNFIIFSLFLPVQSPEAMMALVFFSFFLVAVMEPYIVVLTSADSREYLVQWKKISQMTFKYNYDAPKVVRIYPLHPVGYNTFTSELQNPQ